MDRAAQQIVDAVDSLGTALRVDPEAEKHGVSSQSHARVNGIMNDPESSPRTPRVAPRPATTPGEVRRRLGIAAARASAHPFPQAVLATGKTVSDWSAAHGLKHYVVRNWYGAGRKGRPIPRQWAEVIEREFAIPASAWPRGIKG